MNQMRSIPVRDDGLLVVNAGSSSIKFAVYKLTATHALSVSCRGEVTGLGAQPRMLVRDSRGKLLYGHRLPRMAHDDIDDVMAAVLTWVEGHLNGARLVAAGHRVALGGLEHSAPLLLSPADLQRLRTLVPLAPLHQPHNLAPVDWLWAHSPALSQVACFDTAFHRNMPRRAELYGLPRSLTDNGARRYGFHGLSYEYVAGRLREIAPAAAEGRTVIAHLGSGASMCALDGGRSIATTMGFSPLGGLVMGTRPGELDAGLVLWLLRERGLTPDEIETMLYKYSGLLGVSGISGDMRELLASPDPRAREAVDLFVYRACRELGSLAAALGGLDALVFTGGIGEHATEVRAAICRQSSWLGIALDDDANAKNGPRISTADSKLSVWVIPTDEERMIANHTAALALAGEPTPLHEASR